MAALSEEDLKRVSELVVDLQIVRFDCGHGIHIEKPKEFVEGLIKAKRIKKKFVRGVSTERAKG